MRPLQKRNTKMTTLWTVLHTTAFIALLLFAGIITMMLTGLDANQSWCLLGPDNTGVCITGN